MMLLGLFMMMPGLMLLAGEYLCVEVAWRCLDYNHFYTGLGALLFGVGLVVSLLGVTDD